MKSKRRILFFVLSYLFPVLAIGATIQKLSVKDNGFVGHYYQQPADSSKQPVIVFGGSEGGIPTRLAKVIASNGFPTLAVAYFREESLPDELEKIPLEYFDKARNWLHLKHPKAKNFTLAGWSKGAELSLLLASKDATFNRVVAIAPSSVVWAGILNDWQKTPGSSWTFEQQELPYVHFNPTSAVNGLLDLYSQSLTNREDSGKASIKAEDISGRVFLYSGGNDEIWPSNLMAESVCQRMERNETSTCKHLHYPALDHLLDGKILVEAEKVYREFINSVGGGG
ncbi:acyl-CoA thioester hydrolase/BAAT C-terminal domain-containing protein [Alteromonas sp. H39]|uniref:acyl-CoA thioester hydrolase/BAAT C-terminal domain-containing protein n=1 Tax=Alteromonas sp. H39 TaxID=3389876 RepID=UPI0039E00246